MIQSVLFFGTRCEFADVILARIVAEGFSVSARVIPGHAHRSTPFREQNPPADDAPIRALPIARQSEPDNSRYPTVAVNDHEAREVAERLREFEADISVVCCYPLRVPMPLVQSTRLGGVNVHPSLLPEYRGPEPLFWMFRNGERTSGVTIHQVSETLDAGAILKQQHLDVPIGTPGNELWLESAKVGANLLAATLTHIGPAVENARPQNEHEASYYSWPQQSDLTIDPDSWNAWRVFHFCNGVIPLGYSPVVMHCSVPRIVLEAIGYEERNERQERGAGLVAEWIPCRTGAVYLRLGMTAG